MNTTDKKEPDDDDIEMLLPWYVTNKLESSDRALVEGYLERHPAMKDRLDAIRQERDETVFLNEQAPGKPTMSADRFMAEVAGVSSARRSGVVSWIKGLFQLPATGGVRWAGVAAVFLILVQAAVIVKLVGLKDDGNYRQASGTGQLQTTGSAVLVRFTDGATVSGIAKMLSDLDMEIMDGPKAGGLFRVWIGPVNISQAERESRVRALRTRKDLVFFVTVTK